MAVYTHSTPARYTHGSTNTITSKKGARATTFSRKISGLRTRSRDTSLLNVRKRIYSAGFPEFGAARNVTFVDGTDAGSTKDLVKKDTGVIGKSPSTFRSNS